uniref:Globin domain-containing protein n=2 Tax=Chaetoceros debilis TaxID=122233 RepID=A0A7S3QJH8_9STRA|mmetsp:Transcript_3658/g.5121  ORF Transcript_3658/g.5121 Transcript_3658/m.5121 type:complete len:153 (-) Transcript_3658:285-743(-)|eukprot:CAMPEP_0194078158 /NCGR_PEP_ID=MMETSP0149-20130528/4624_1 /TAXON_ID=122233 /ORGANISM="Chaetoceros debilis, Strain MM31A-1" /LENGTH=152 /DNA_ID=CAMNT_0038759359 /DNA_START=50 /DNA_END=508 /DNA_ORIENTATION=-
MASKVIESWKLITAIPNYEEVAGELLFKNIFTIAPEAYGLFSFSKDYDIMSNELFASQKFKKHAAGVIGTVNVAVGMLGPDLSPLADILKGLGRKHKVYGVLEAHYDIVGQALIQTLSDAMADAFSDEVKAAWGEVWGVISSTMIEGAGYRK